MKNQLSQLIEQARSAKPAHIVGLHPDGSVRATVPQGILRSTVLDLGQSVPDLSAYFDADWNLRRIPSAPPSTSQAAIDPLTVARAHSRAALLGTHLLLREPALQPQPTGHTGLVAFAEETSAFGTVKPVKLIATADGADYPATTALPLAIARVNWATVPTYGAHLKLSRATYRDALHADYLDDLLLAAILAGAGRIADQALLAALPAASLQPFTLAAAAAAGHRFNDLRALIGTTGTGATVDASGVLRAAGIPAELTDAGAGTVVGAFGCAAVLLDREIRVTAQRAADDIGGMVITVNAAAAALVPDMAGAFWKVAA